MNQSRVYIDRLDAGYASRLRQGLEWIDLKSKIGWGDTVFIKPNLTFPVFRKGVMTNPECIEALVQVLRDYTDRIIIGEADSGGYNRFPIDEVFARTGMMDLEKRYGVRLVNMSFLPFDTIRFGHRNRSYEVAVPKILREETDLFISVPVPKIHMNTGVSMAVKNQWGCIPEPKMRLALHPIFEKAIFEVNRSIRQSIAVVDGKYGLTRSGPLLGDVVDLNWLMVSENLYAADFVSCMLMRINPEDIYYLRHLQRKEKVVPPLNSLCFNQDFRPFISKQKFYLQRAWTDYPGLFAFRSSFLSYLAYFSPLADVLHKALYLVRRPFYDYESPSQTLS